MTWTKKRTPKGSQYTKASLLRQTATYQEVGSTIIFRDTATEKVDSL